MPAQNRLVVPVAAQSLPLLPVAEPQASIGSMVAESAVLVALAEQEKAVVVAQVAAPAALDAEHVAAVPALQAAAGPVDAAAQTHKAVGTGVAATDEQPHAPGR